MKNHFYLIGIAGFLLSIPLGAFSQTGFTYNDSSRCAPATVDFNNTSTIGITYRWYINNDSVSSDTNLTYTFNQPAMYAVALAAYDSAGTMIGLYYDFITIGGVNLVATSATSCPGDNIIFTTDVHGGEALEAFWDFGDGTTATSNTIVHSYDTTGTYSVILIINHSSCGVDTLQTTIQVSSSTIPQLTSFPMLNPACPGDNISIIGIGAAGALMYDFGDGTPPVSVDLPFVSHIFDSAGTYTVMATVVNNCGNSDTAYTTISIQNNLAINPGVLEKTGDFASPNPLCPYDFVWFNAGDDEPYYNIWTFGDGDTVYGENLFPHLYPVEGDYIASLTYVNGCGSDTTFYDTVMVRSNVFPDMKSFDFKTIPETACPGDSLIFIGSAGAASYHWDFGDGTVDSINSPEIMVGVEVFVAHVFDSAGTYQVIISVTNQCGLSGSDTIMVTIGNNLSPEYAIAPFYWRSESGAQLGSGTLPLTCEIIEFVPLAGGKLFYWDFGDGDTAISTTLFTPHRYASAGTYNVTLTIINSCGNSGTFSNYMIVTGDCIFPCPYIEAVDTSLANCGVSNGSASIDVIGGVPPYSFAWSNGDTLSMNDSLGSGIYTVTVTDAAGCSEFTAVSISDKESQVFTGTNIIHVSCNGGNDGAIDISVSGGVQPYTYLWSNGSTDEDIILLKAGPYEVNVSDNNGCQITQSISIEEPLEIKLNVVTIKSSCSGSTGAATVFASQGTWPYEYVWSSGSTSATATGLAAGIYTVTVYDLNNCTSIGIAAISDNNGPVITLDSIFDSDCGTIGGSVFVSVSGGTSPYTYEWSDGSVTEDLTGISAGIYNLSVTDFTGCIGAGSFSISGTIPYTPEICLVTVDSATGKNLCVFSKDTITGNKIDHFNIFKESTVSNLYYLVGSVPFGSLSEWVDPSSDPAIRSWRYKIIAVDSCGNESGYSTPHKTIHLTMNVGITGAVNLIWDHYNGFSFGTYYIYRYSSIPGWEILDSLSSNNTSYSDPNPPGGVIFYQVVVKHPGTCTADKVKKYNASKSNTAVTAIVGQPPLQGPSAQGGVISITPNPTKRDVRIRIQDSEFKNAILKIFDVLGSQVKEAVINNQSSKINLSDLQPGVYFIEVKSGNYRIGREKLLVE